MKYIGPDFCNITTLLTDEELLIQKTANEFVTKEFMPLVRDPNFIVKSFILLKFKGPRRYKFICT